AAVQLAHAEDLPGALDALELLRAALLEGDPRADDEVLDRARGHDLGRPGERDDARADVDGDPLELAVDRADLAGMQAGAHVEPELMDGADDRRCGLDR